MVASTMDSESAMQIDVSTLMVHSEFLRRVALGLLGDESLADDAVQETWLTAMKSRPSSPSKIRGWLASVTRNEARQIVRGESRRTLREEASSRPEGVPSAADIAERERVRREVVEMVMQLEPPYRDVVLLRYYEDLPPREIARRLAVPSETVRTRLRRATDQMRSRLDRHHESREAWRHALLPLAFPAAGRVEAAGAVLSVVAMAGKVPLLVATLILLLVGAIGWLTWPDGEPGAAREAATVAPVTDERLAAMGGQAGEPALEAYAPAADTVPAGANLAAPAIFGTVSTGGVGGAGRAGAGSAGAGGGGAGGGGPVTGQVLLLQGQRGDSLADIGGILVATSEPPDPAKLVEHEVTTDAAGRYAFAAIEPGAYLLSTLAIDGHPVRVVAIVFVGLAENLPAGVEAMLASTFTRLGAPPPSVHEIDRTEVYSLDIERRAGRRLHGRIVDADQQPVVGAVVHVAPAFLLSHASALDQPITPPMSRATTDAYGAFEVEGALGATGLAVVADGFTTSLFSFDVEAPDDTGATMDIGDHMLDAATLWLVRGIVVDADGPVAGATIRRRFQPQPESLVSATTDALGRFEVSFGLKSGRSTTLRVEAEGYTPVDVHLPHADSAATDDVQVTLERSSTLHIRLVDPDGQPIDEGWAQLSIAGAVGAAHDSHARTTIEAGIGTFASVPAARVRLEAGAPGHEPAGLDLDFSEGITQDTVEITLQPIAWQVVVRTVTATGDPAPERIRFADANVDFPYFTLHLYRDDPTALIEARATAASFPGAAWSDPTPFVNVDAAGERVLRIPKVWQGDRAWLVLRLAGHPAVVEPIDRATREVIFRVDPDAVRRATAVVGVEPQSPARRLQSSTAVIHDPDGRRLGGVGMRFDTPPSAFLVERPGRYRARLFTPEAAGIVEIDVELGRAWIARVPLADAGAVHGRIVAASASGTIDAEPLAAPRDEVTIEPSRDSVVVYSGDFPRVILIDDSGRCEGVAASRDGRFLFTGLAAGDYKLRARLAGHGMVTVPIRLEAGQKIPDMLIEVPPSPVVELGMDRGLLGGGYSAEGSWRLESVDDGAVVDEGDTVRAAPGSLYRGPLVPGVYRMTLLTGVTGRIESTFAITSESAGLIVLDFD